MRNTEKCDAIPDCQRNSATTELLCRTDDTDEGTDDTEKDSNTFDFDEGTALSVVLKSIRAFAMLSLLSVSSVPHLCHLCG
ncbi:MAG TPA: hypothetical protein VKO87_13900, partial [Gemmatimonadaceae bacterium]|nr:hypothetical protein [Gemmatimonadaceae bacterium]